MFLPLAHAAAVAINCFSIWYDQVYLELAPLPQREQIVKLPLKGRVIYLTVWGLILQTVYFSIAFLNDLIGTNEPSPRKAPLIRIIKDYVFTLAFAQGLFTLAVFWGIYFYDRELIFPIEATKNIPHWLNHTSHTTVGVFILIELLATKRTYPSQKAAVTLAVLFMAAYIVWQQVLHAWYGTWVYPIFDVLNVPATFAFHAFNISLISIFAAFGKTLNDVVSVTKKEAGPKRKRR